MPKIVKLAELLPEDIVFELPGGGRYTFPGDPPLQLVLKIASIFERAQVQGDGDAEAAEDGTALEMLQELDDELVTLLRMRDDSISESPFGVMGAQHVVAELLAAYNFGAEDADAEDPPKAPNRASRRSSGSGRSSSSSASRRATGTK